jgi:hypothetical protein
MFGIIKLGDLVIRRNDQCPIVGLVISISYSRSEMPKNEPDNLYKYAIIHWSTGVKSTVKISLLEKIS